MGRRTPAELRAQRQPRAAPAPSDADDGPQWWQVSESSHDSWRGTPYVVRPVPGARATKVYRCPGCDHEIAPGLPHVVTWPADHREASAERRHWHRRCWQRRPGQH